ncbi:hypothetical protein JOB18_009104 [Solea senegalensis]|uniref:Uncharacterized protein n=1 Tax=Solea senegalensis TaxID=28829 RepID=A0AAV6T546_SOLSE|nr:hypothetical protein JOB18_009104 [Solea senegalensis]KAG7524239.1 hypothetical protein JOB18_009104 [Solea senegalensis]
MRGRKGRQAPELRQNRSRTRRVGAADSLMLLLDSTTSADIDQHNEEAKIFQPSYTIEVEKSGGGGQKLTVSKRARSSLRSLRAESLWIKKCPDMLQLLKIDISTKDNPEDAVC